MEPQGAGTMLHLLISSLFLIVTASAHANDYTVTLTPAEDATLAYLAGKDGNTPVEALTRIAKKRLRVYDKLSLAADRQALIEKYEAAAAVDRTEIDRRLGIG